MEFLIQEHEKHPDNPILFPSPKTGDYWSPSGVSRINKLLLERADIDTGVRFHDLRHTFATMAMQSGVDVKTLSSMLGHYSAGFTLDTYTHVTRSCPENWRLYGEGHGQRTGPSYHTSRRENEI